MIQFTSTKRETSILLNIQKAVHVLCAKVLCFLRFDIQYINKQENGGSVHLSPSLVMGTMA